MGTISDTMTLSVSIGSWKEDVLTIRGIFGLIGEVTITMAELCGHFAVLLGGRDFGARIEAVDFAAGRIVVGAELVLRHLGLRYRVEAQGWYLYEVTRKLDSEDDAAFNTLARMLRLTHSEVPGKERGSGSRCGG